MANNRSTPTSRSDRSSLQLVRIGRRQFVVGMFWQDVASRQAMRDARQIGQRDKFDLVVIRQAGLSSAQAGFIASGRGVRAGLYSMAAALAHRLGRKSFVGIFAVPDDAMHRFVLCAVQDGHVLPGYDRIGSLSEVTPFFQEAVELSPSWEAVFVPENFAIPASLSESPVDRSRDLTKLFALRSPTGVARLKPLKIQMSGGTWLLILGMCIGAGMWYGWIPVPDFGAYLPAWITDKSLPVKTAVNTPKNVATPPNVPATQVAPWTSQIPLKPFLEACTGAIHALPVQVQGWLFEEARCKQTAPTQLTLTARYKRQFGTVRQFLEAVRAQTTEPTFSENFDVATLNVPLSVEIASHTEETLLPQAQRLASFASNLQSLGISFKLNADPTSTGTPAAMPGPADTHAPAAPSPAWQTSQWSFETRMAPLSVLAALDSTGIRAGSIKIRLRAFSNQPAAQANSNDLTLPLNWTVEGFIYAK